MTKDQREAASPQELLETLTDEQQAVLRRACRRLWIRVARGYAVRESRERIEADVLDQFAELRPQLTRETYLAALLADGGPPHLLKTANGLEQALGRAVTLADVFGEKATREAAKGRNKRGGSLTPTSLSGLRAHVGQQLLAQEERRRVEG